MINSQGFIVHKTGYKEGRRHTIMIFIENNPVIPKEVVNVFDLGYLGVEKDFPRQTSSIPKRKKRSMGLLQEEKEYNLQHAKKRIVIEHTICRIKKYRIISDVFRNKLKNYNKVSDIVAGVVNHRIMNYHN